MKLKKLAEKGFSHLIVPVVVVVGVASVGTYILVASHADSVTPNPYACSSQPTIGNGNAGTCVKRVQWFLNYNATHSTSYHYPGVNPLTIDGQFGPATKADVVNFQKGEQITADGIVGPTTWSHLNICATSRMCD